MIGGQKSTTPIHNGPETMEQTTTVPTPCETFFDLIADFHNKQMNTITLQNNDPGFVNHVETILQNQKDIILNFLNTNKIPNDIDSSLKKLLLDLQKITGTYNCQQAALETYILDMFSTYPFTLTNRHIQHLKKKLFYDTENLQEE